MHIMLTRTPIVTGLFLLWSMFGTSYAMPGGVLNHARALSALPGGGWLALQADRAEVLDAAGRIKAQWPLHAKLLDTRAREGDVLAAVYDTSAAQPLLLHIDPVTGAMREGARLPSTSGTSALCLYRDAQRLDHLFLVAQDGKAQQWLLSGPRPRLFREFALVPKATDCRVDDATHTLYLGDAHLGVWSYGIEGERAAKREAVTRRKPYGPLDDEVTAFVPLPDGLAVLTSTGKTLHALRRGSDGWNVRSTHMLPAPVDPEALTSGAEPGLLYVRHAKTGAWQSVRIDWPEAAEHAAPPLPIVRPYGQTDPVSTSGDAADDPAIWIHPHDGRLSRVLGTNKQSGLLVYDLQGRELQSLVVGRLNNVDLRQDVRLDGRGTPVDLAVATHRDDNALALFEIDEAGRVAEVARLATDLPDLYGLCLYQPASGGLEVFANDQDGTYVHYRLEHHKGQYAARLLRRFKVDSQPEGCVTDDRAGRLFFGEENRGVWVMPADARQHVAPQLIIGVGEHLRADVEGMALYRNEGGHYLVVSSQGNDSYVVLDAEPPYRYRGAFRVGIHAELGIDGASETDGLGSSAVNFGEPYEQGMLVVQDGHKRLPDGPQNFKYVPWNEIAQRLGLVQAND